MDQNVLLRHPITPRARYNRSPNHSSPFLLNLKEVKPIERQGLAALISWFPRRLETSCSPDHSHLL